MDETKKEQIFKELYKTSEYEAIKDFIKLKKINDNKILLCSRTGNKFVDYFTAKERLNTIGRKGISFFDFINKIDDYKKLNYVSKLYKYQVEISGLSDIEAYRKIYQLYFGSISIFKPIISKKIYLKYKPSSILDFCMGWGGRLAGACSLNINNYIGIDTNKNLIEPYNKLISTLKDHSTTNIKLIFDDCLNIDYKSLKYDFVFTSPPYYNTELYNGTEKRTIEEWNTKFYIPIIKKTFEGLEFGGK